MNTKEWFNWWVEKSQTYFTDMSWKFSMPELIKRLGIKKHHYILEIGFGYGRELYRFCELSDNVCGLELTDWACKETLKLLRQRGVSPLPSLYSYDGVAIPFSEESFHFIYSCFVIQHLSRQHAEHLIIESLRTLKPEGRVLFEFFGDPEFHNNGYDVFSGEDGKGGMFNNAYTRDEISSIIEGRCGGKVDWIEHHKITKDWGNNWVCFGK